MTAPRRALIIVDVQTGVLRRHPCRSSTRHGRSRWPTSLARDRRPREPAQRARGRRTAPVPPAAPGSSPRALPSWQLHPEDRRRRDTPSRGRRVTQEATPAVFAGTDVADRGWPDQGVDSITIVGYMTNNCDIASAAAAEELGLYQVEILSDASGAIHLANDQGKVDAPPAPRDTDDTAALKLRCRSRPPTGSGPSIRGRHLRRTTSSVPR